MKLTKTQFEKGMWEGRLTGAGNDTPQIQVTHLGASVDGHSVTPDRSGTAWNVRIPVPGSLIGDGTQTFLISDLDGNVLNSFTLQAGEALAEDIRAELALLRSELDILKQSFRRHCNES